MLTSTFIHAPGIGPATERSLWEQDIACWSDYANLDSCETPPRIPARHRATLDRVIAGSIEALEAERVDYFARHLATRDHWRAVNEFPRLGYLDIETDGGYDSDSITIIGISDGFDTKIYTKGINLAEFAFDCQEFDGFVTFFGGGFDVPFLKRRFPVLERVFADRLHVDLCPLLKSVGYKGGLKSIERQLGIARRPETDGLSGMDAVRLWRAYRRGGGQAEEALRLLHAYNEEDVVNMKRLLEIALPLAATKVGLPSHAIARPLFQNGVTMTNC